MEDGKYKVVKEINVYNCIHGQLGIGIGVIFEISNCGGIAKVGDVLFSPKLLKYCEEKFIKI